MTESFHTNLAVIGLAAKFPGADTVDQFWKNLRNGVESIYFFSNNELMKAGISSDILHHLNYVKAKGIINQAEYFDADFFSFSALEAEMTDPQQRLFLQSAWHALENAGYCPDYYSGLIGVYASCNNSMGASYFYQHTISQPDLMKRVGDYQLTISNNCDFLTTRVAYKLGLRGPAVTLQTACSSSLVAVHYACQDLLNYRCDIALAGGVSITFPLYEGYLYQEGMIGSSDGHCRAFSEDAQGTVGGNGVGVIVLKRLDDAINEGDFIYAIIKGTAINNDGHAKIGFTAPSIEGQKAVVTAALTAAQVLPEEISYIEAHGTGTPLGDPIEIQALAEVFATKSIGSNRCGIGSVKSNIGHLGAAAGIAGLIKTILAIKNKELPPSLHCAVPNHKIDWANSPFYINTHLKAWENGHIPLYAGVSSFGIGGTNAHVIVGETPLLSPIKSERKVHLLCFSAKSGETLEKTKHNLLNSLQETPEPHLAAAGYTLHTGRRHWEYRHTIIVSDKNLPSEISLPQKTFAHPKLVFMFSGQGSQYPEMGKMLYEKEHFFKKSLDECAEILQDFLKFDIREILLNSNVNPVHDIYQTSIAQPALFALEYSLAQLWLHWGIKPEAMIGHSIGEYVAACLARVFSLSEGLKLVTERGRLMQQLPAGEMLAVLAHQDDVVKFLPSYLDLAAVNSPQHCVISGLPEKLQSLKLQLDKATIPYTKINTSHAFHSRYMDPILSEFADVVAQVSLKEPQLPFISNLTGTWITESQAKDPYYWVDHLRKMVQFSEGIRSVLENSYNIFLEIGPGHTLNKFVKQHLKEDVDVTIISSLPTFKQKSSSTFLEETIGTLWKSGININWENYYQPAEKRRIPLPSYPFQLKKYTIANEVSFDIPEVNEKLYHYTWQQAPLSKSIKSNAEQILIFADKSSFSLQLKEVFHEQQKNVFIIEAGEGCFQRDLQHYVIRKNSLEDYVWLLKEILNNAQTPLIILYAWSHIPFSSLHNNTTAMEDCFYGVLYLIQALGKQAYQGNIELKMLSPQQHHVLKGDTVNPFQALLIGHCKVIPQEYPNITCQCIDIGNPQNNYSSEFIKLLSKEILNSCEDFFVAYRNGTRYISHLERVPSTSAKTNRFTIVPGGVYLITGGLGGIGLALAKHLAKKASIQLVLMNRSSFPDRSQWNSYESNSAVAEKISQIQAIEDLGSQIHIYQTDISNEVTMKALIKDIQTKLGPIYGVIHAAGQGDGGVIQTRGNKDIDEVFSAKIPGTCVLDRLFSFQQLDFFILCSSLSSVLGGVGRLDYCAANAFLDKYAEYKRSTGRIKQVISINWDRWREVGMAVDYIKSLSSSQNSNSLKSPINAKPLFSNPLISSWNRNKDGSCDFYAELSPEQHWVLAEHRYQNAYLLPATAYIEMLWDAFKVMSGNDVCEINNMSWAKPMMLRENQKLFLRISFKQEAETMKFFISSQVSGEDTIHENIQGWIQIPQTKGPQHFAIDQLHSRIQGKEVLINKEMIIKNEILEFGEHWQSNSGQITYLEYKAFSQSNLDERFHEELQHYPLHPALLDVAMFGWRVAVNGKYLPFSCESITIFQPLVPQVFSYVQCEKGFSATEEIIKVNVIITNHNSDELVRFNNLTIKRIDL